MLGKAGRLRVVNKYHLCLAGTNTINSCTIIDPERRFDILGKLLYRWRTTDVRTGNVWSGGSLSEYDRIRQ